MSQFFIILFLSVLTFAIEVNQSIELTDYMNARYSARFSKEDQNIQGQLAKGTQGKVMEIKTFSSGNSGLLIQVNDGEFKNQKVWVYYNKTTPTMKLLDEAKKETMDAVQADAVHTTLPTPVRKIPVTPRAVVEQVDQVNQELAKLKTELQPPPGECEACSKASPGQSGGLPESSLPISASVTAAGHYNARIKCSYKSDQKMNLAGNIELEIVNNKVKKLNASVNGCTVNLKNFKQIDMPGTTNVVLEDVNGCAVSITSNLKIKAPSAPVLNFAMVPTYDCVKSCPKIEKAFWQFEMNPNSQTCY